MYYELVDKLPIIGLALLKALLIFVGGHYIIRLVIRIMEKAFLKLDMDIFLQKFLSKTVNIVLHIIVILSAVTALGISIAGLLAALSAAAVAVALALKDSLSSIAGGIILLITKRFKTGDFIEIGGEKGTVVQIDMMHTVLKTIDNRRVMIPNSIAANSQIVDYTSEAMRRLDLVFSVSYTDDAEKAKTVIIETALKNPKVIKDAPEPPFARVTAYSASSVDITMQMWCKTADYLPLKYDLLEQIRKALEENGMTILFNQLDVHLTKTEKN